MKKTGKFSIGASILRPMTARSLDETHRAATPLELLFDLVSVIAIAAAATGLHHSIVENHAATGLISFGMAFFSIWWAWMNFTWFASAYDNDDAIYRVAVFVMMIGSLFLAAGISSMFSTMDFSLGIIGYVIMRFAHVGLLIRAGLHNAHNRKTSKMHAIGIILCQLGWIVGFYFVGQEHVLIFFALMVAFEFMVPAVVSKYGELPWHIGHIAERYGLLTIIVLGESLLSLTVAIQKISHLPDNTAALAIHITAGFVSMFALWWLYFNEKEFKALKKKASTFLWGYGHVVIFASIAAFGAGLAINLDYIDHHAKISSFVANLSVAIPAAGFLIGIWFVHERYNAKTALASMGFPVIAALILASSYLPMALPAVALLLVLAIAMQTRTFDA